MTEREKIIEILKHEKDEFIEEEYHGYITRVDFEKLADTLIENGIGDIARTDKLEKLLFILVRNQIIDKGKKLGKTDDEICDMAIDTIQAMADMVSFEKIGILMGDRKIEIVEERK